MLTAASGWTGMLKHGGADVPDGLKMLPVPVALATNGTCIQFQHDCNLLGIALGVFICNVSLWLSGGFIGPYHEGIWIPRQLQFSRSYFCWLNNPFLSFPQVAEVKRMWLKSDIFVNRSGKGWKMASRDLLHVVNFAPSLRLSKGTQTASQGWTITLCHVGSAKIDPTVSTLDTGTNTLDFKQGRATHPAIFHFWICTCSRPAQLSDKNVFAWEDSSSRDMEVGEFRDLLVAWMLDYDILQLTLKTQQLLATGCRMLGEPTWFQGNSLQPAALNFICCLENLMALGVQGRALFSMGSAYHLSHLKPCQDMSTSRFFEVTPFMWTWIVH